MADDHVARQSADSIDIEERDLPELSAGQAGVVYFTPGADGATFAAVLMTGLDPALAATFVGGRVSVPTSSRRREISRSTGGSSERQMRAGRSRLGLSTSQT